MQLPTMLLCCTWFCLASSNTTDLNTTELQPLRAVRGQDARLPCGPGKVFLDGPDSFVLWMKNDHQFLYRFPPSSDKKATRDYRLSTLCESDICPDDASLLIRKASKRDEGLYRCRIHYQGSPNVDFIMKVKLVESIGLPRLYDGSGKLLNLGFVGPLSLGSDLTLICEVVNNDSDTKVYWLRNGVIVKHLLTSRPGKFRSEVQLRNLSRGDLETHYECLARNSDVSEPLSASVTIKMYLPAMSVEIRMNNNNDFEAGQPRVVDCVVVGCIPPPAIVWTLGNKMVRPSVHKELHDGNYTVSSLTLVPSLHDHRKELICCAYNSHMPDTVFEDKVTLNVGFRPTCQGSHEDNTGAVVGEVESVQCVVDAYPEPQQFSWTFADSKTLYSGVTKLSNYRNRYTSNLTWITRDGDFGILMCRATNAFGQQKKPCMYNITAGGPPERPKCEVQRIYPNSLRAQCVKGWDGGRPQMIHLDIVDKNGCCIKNVTNSSGQFFVPNIVDQCNLTVVLYASNTRGKSDTVTIYLHTLTPISEADSNYIQSTLMPYIEAVAGTVGLSFALLSIILVFKILMARRVLRRNTGSPDHIVPCSDGVFHREPDFVRDERLRDERLLGTTNITVNQMASCQNQYSPSPLPACRVLLGHGLLSPHDGCSPSQHSYYV